MDHNITITMTENKENQSEAQPEGANAQLVSLQCCDHEQRRLLARRCHSDSPYSRCQPLASRLPAVCGRDTIPRSTLQPLSPVLVCHRGLTVLPNNLNVIVATLGLEVTLLRWRLQGLEVPLPRRRNPLTTRR